MKSPPDRSECAERVDSSGDLARPLRLRGQMRDLDLPRRPRRSERLRTIVRGEKDLTYDWARSVSAPVLSGAARSTLALLLALHRVPTDDIRQHPPERAPHLTC